RALEQEPPRLGEQRGSSLLTEGMDFGAAHVIDGIAHVLRDVKAVEDVERVARLLGDDLQIRLPHVAADEPERSGALLPEPAKKLEERFGAPVLADPEQPLARRID